jgi:transcriptional regulator with XRE-family HTH domain
MSALISVSDRPTSFVSSNVEQGNPRITVINGELIGGEELTCGQRVRALRERSGLTGKDLSEIIGGRPTGNSITRMEKEDRVSRRLAELAAEVFKITDYTVLDSTKSGLAPVKVVGGEITGGEGLKPGQILSVLRTNLGLEQKALSKRVGIGARTISRYESGQGSITMKSSGKLTAFFGITNARSFCPSKEIQVFVDRGQVIGGEGLAPHELLFALRDGYRGGLPQKELGKRTQITGLSISKYEAGFQRIPQRASAKLAHFFGIDDLWIFCKESTVFVENGQLRGADGLTCGQIVRALRMGRNLTTDQLSERIGGTPKGKSIQVLETTNQIGRETAELFATEFGLADHTLLLSKKPEATRSTSTTESKKRKRSDDDPLSDLVIRAGSPIRPPLYPLMEY